MAEIVNRIIAESGGRVTISSGFRSRAEQESLYAKYKAGQGNLAAKPGTSKHEHGLAVDFGGDLNLARQLATKYGLAGTVPGEPWHFSLGGEGGAHTERYNEYDLGDDTSSNPQDVLANRMQSILSIMGQSTAAQSPGYDNPGIDQAFTPNRDYTEAEGMAEAQSLANPTTSTTTNSPKGTLQKYAAKKLSDEYGMSAGEMGSLITLWNKESGWNPNADNPTSTAYGIAQFLNGTWAGVGAKKTSDPYQQIDAGLRYIVQRYGSPSNALKFHLKNNYY
jgi:hypothetical protein